MQIVGELGLLVRCPSAAQPQQSYVWEVVEHLMNFDFRPDAVHPIVCVNLGVLSHDSTMGIGATVQLAWRFVESKDDVTWPAIFE